MKSNQFRVVKKKTKTKNYEIRKEYCEITFIRGGTCTNFRGFRG
jgi:hypothetical protein